MPILKLPPVVKTSISVFLVGVMGLLATGCASGTSSQAVNYPIRVWRFNQSVDPFRDTFNQFQTAHSNVTISYQNHTLDSYELDALASLASQTGPELWSIPSDWISDEQDRLVALPDNFFGEPSQNNNQTATDRVKKLYPPDVATSLIGTDNKVYGLASNFDLLRLYYNPDLFSQSFNSYQRSLGSSPSDSQIRPVQELLSAPGKTWDQILKQIPYLTRKSGGSITHSAIALGGADNTPDAQDVLALLMYQNGTEITSSDHTRTLFNTQQGTPSGTRVRPGENALSFYSSFAVPNNANYTWNPSLPQAMDAFGQGEVAMVIAYANFGSQLKSKYPQFQFSTADVPQINTTDAPVHLGRFSADTVTKAASSVNAGLSLLHETEQAIVVNNLARESKLRSPLLSTLTSQANDDAQSKAILTTRTVYKKNHTQFDASFLQMIRDVVQNGATPAGALDVGAQKINEILTPRLQAATPKPS